MTTTTTPRSALPLLAAAQAQKHVTHNEALLQLDALLFARFLDRDLAAPPGSPADGDTYLIHATATGAWTGKDGQIAFASDGAWRFYAPFTGLVAYVVDETKLIVFDGAAWTDYASLLALQNVPLLGVNTTADTTNKFAVKSAALLFDNVGGGVQAKLNKHAASDTASLLYQTAYSGRAEFGLTGDDDFHLKVSPDGTTWYEALKLARSGGAATFLAAASASAFVPSGSAVPANGLYLPAANTLGWAVNTAEKARLTASGLSLLTTLSNGALTVAGVTAPDADNSRDLGTASYQFRSAYLGTSLVFLGTSISAKTGSGALVLSASPSLSGTVTGPDGATWSSSGVAGLTSLLIGSASPNAKLFVNGAVGGTNTQLNTTTGNIGLVVLNASSSGTEKAVSFYQNGAERGSITTTNTATAYNTSSDARLKTVLDEQADYRRAIEALWVGDFAWKDTGAKGFGILAQQAYTVMPHGLGVARPDNEADRWFASSEPFAHLALWGVKDLYVLVARQEAEIAALKARLAESPP